MTTEWWLYIAVAAAGLASGFINTLAGSGSLLTLPLLMFMGLPANVANGTNRIGILFQCAVATTGFKRQKVLDVKTGLVYSIPSILGAIAGAILALSFSDVAMEKAIGILLLVMFFLVLFKPEVWIKGHTGKIQRKPNFWILMLFFIIGLYGGFIQAGVGLFLLAGLVLGVGADLVKANALKVFLVLLYTPVVLIFFMKENQIDYLLGIILAIGSSAGAYLGTKVAVSWGPKFIRIVLLLAVLVFSLKLLGVLNFVAG
ncbi:MAG: sulfite exporter TauE/SafE family protein [Bacteroidales bacterium]|nr:sulfite exporter TauE/SafE family protein [Bacteroidales bacterium]